MKKLDQIAEIMTAYSDCCSHSGERNLNYFCTAPLTAQELPKVMSAAVPDGYNAFDENSVLTLIDVFGQESEYYVARESSVCIYVKPRSHNIWLTRDINWKLLADEVLFCPDKQMFRVWWD